MSKEVSIKILTATEATGELNVKGPIQPIAKSQLLIGGWNCVPGLETAVSVHVKAKQAAITDGTWTVGGK